MKKNILPVLVTILSIITIVSFTIAGILTFSSGNWSEKLKLIGDTQIVNINDTKTVAITNIQTINIDGVYSDIIIKKATGDILEMSYKGSRSSFFSNGNIPELRIKPSDNSILLVVDDADEKLNFHMNWFSNSHSVLEVLIPASFDGNLNIYNVSGIVNIDEQNLDKLSVKTVSGNISIEKTPTKSLFINTTSGVTTLRNGCGSINFESVSGEFTAGLSELKDMMTLKSVSGNLNITIPHDIAFNTNFSSVSGKYYPPRNYVNGGQAIKTNTVSGNLNIFIE